MARELPGFSKNVYEETWQAVSRLYVNHCASKDTKEYFKPLHNMKWEEKGSQEYRRFIDFTVHPNKNVLNMKNVNKNEYFLII